MRTLDKAVRLSIASLLIVLAQLSAWSQIQKTAATGGGYVANHGVKIWYRVEGKLVPSSVPLLVLHGGPGATARPFEKTIGPEIAKTRPVIYMDYRGAGRSDRPKNPSDYSFSILASDAEAIREHLGIERWAVFGHSNGGATAITYALQYPSRVAALVLCDPLLSPADLEMNMIHKVALAPPDKYEQARAVYQSNQSADERFGRLLDLIDIKTRYGFQYFDPKTSDVLEQIQDELGKEIGKPLMEPALMQGLIESGFFEFDAFKSAKKLSAPVLVMAGRHDSEISLDNAMSFAVKLPDGYFTIFEHSGHHPYLEETKAASDSIIAFLASHYNPS